MDSGPYHCFSDYLGHFNVEGHNINHGPESGAEGGI